MHPSPMHYFPVTPPFMVLLFVAFAALVVLLQFGVITYAYEKMGVASIYSRDPAAVFAGECHQHPDCRTARKRHRRREEP